MVYDPVSLERDNTSNIAVVRTRYVRTPEKEGKERTIQSSAKKGAHEAKKERNGEERKRTKGKKIKPKP